MRPRLKDPARLANGCGEPLDVFDRETARLFAVDVFARLGGEDRRRGVPAITRGNNHGINVGAVQQLSQVAVEHAVGVPLQLVDQGLARLASTLLHVGDRHAPHIGQAEHRREHIGATRADANDPQVDLLAGGHRPIPPQRTGRDDGGKAKRTSRSEPHQRLPPGHRPTNRTP